MRLGGMLEAWSAQRSTPNAEELGFDERFGLLVDAEEAHRENKRFKRALNEARLKIGQACVEGIDYPPKRTLDKTVIRQLASCRWITEAHHVSVTGSTGTGKTYVACALAHQACRKGYRAIYRKMSRLFQELRLARADGTYPRVLARLARLNVLVPVRWTAPPGPAPEFPRCQRQRRSAFHQRGAGRTPGGQREA